MNLDLAHIGNTPLDITEFDAVADSEHGFEFELKDKDGITGTGVFVTVQGKHADEVSKWMNALVNKMTREAQMAQRKGKQVDPKSLEEMRDQNIDGAALRVTGWRNVKQPFARDLLKVAMKRNPHWVDQVIEESDNLGNFTKAV
ncbi:MAG: hypothetical protein WA191_06790 [Telluria sp.]